MIKIFTLLLMLSSFISLGQQTTEFIISGGIQDNDPNINNVLSDAVTSLNGNGTITIKGDIEVRVDFNIPEGIELKFFKGNKFIIKGNTTLTINGSINAGQYQIFELEDNGTVEDCFWDRWDFTLDDGKVRGNLKNNYIIPQWWDIDDTGVIPCGQNFQKAIESFPSVQKFVANGKFLLEKTLHLNQNNHYYDFSGATFVGVNEDRDVCQAFKDSYLLWYNTPAPHGLPTTFPATDTGGLINIGKLRDLTETSPYSVVNVTLYGGIYIPKNKYDNALGILNAKNIKILNVTIDCYNGQRGIALQPHKNWNVPTRTDHIIVRDVIQQGGTNVFNIDIDSNSNTSNVIVSNVVGHDIGGHTADPNDSIREAAFRISSGGSIQKIHNITISEVILSSVYKAFNVSGASGILSNIQVINSETNWLEGTNPDLKVENVRIH
ncbi:hypothetical protein [Aquimarina megaterium]|uniref:hypothetical protein n=1 Tax=Aquimarina megaterium TaxID=1443666 RepID=UPI0004B494C1|nr:hypothetical protein [Aquimarina megaterium]